MDKRFRILVVDDEHINIQVMTAVLKDEYDVLTAMSGFDAVSQIKEHMPDLILLDVMMPDLNGFDVCSIIKADAAISDIPVIFLTALHTTEGEIQGLELGGIDYLTKPINFTLLKLRVRNHLELNKRNELIREQRDLLVSQKEELAHMLAELELQYAQQRETAEAMREMANTLSEQFIEIKQNNELLEQRVEERTEELRENERFTLDVIDSLTSNIVVLDSNGIIVTVNEPWRRFASINSISTTIPIDIGKEYLSVFRDSIERSTEEGIKATYYGIRSVLQGESSHFTQEYSCHSPTEQRWFVMNASSLSGSRRGAVISHTDITKRKRMEKALEESNRKLENLSNTDGLTGIANRRHFDEVLAHEHIRHARSGAELSLIMLDIDYFKAFNDNYGHVSGDECLRQLARVIAECVARPADLAARYGGEEFACILPETGRNGAIVIAEKIRRRILELAIPHSGSNVADFITASLGVVTVKCTCERSVLEIVAQVDDLLYRAKSCGRNRLEFVASAEVALKTHGDFRGNLLQLVWDDDFCCGNQLIDTQHRSLFQTSNKLLEKVLSTHHSEDLSSNVIRLLDEVKQHFHDEERILEASGFPGINQHVEEHTRLLSKGFEFSRKLRTSDLSAGDAFLFLAYEMVMLHMLGADCEYFPYTNGHNNCQQKNP